MTNANVPERLIQQGEPDSTNPKSKDLENQVTIIRPETDGSVFPNSVDEEEDAGN